MNFDNFSNALVIISGHHSSIVKINTPKDNFVGDLGDKEFRLHISKCVPSVINSLVKAGYMLSMTEDGLLVDKV